MCDGVKHMCFCTLGLLSYLLESKDCVDGERFPFILREGANNLGHKDNSKSKQRIILNRTSCPSLYCAACSY